MAKFDSDWIPQSAMTIFAHPDDMEFSCGATLAKWAKAALDAVFPRAEMELFWPEEGPVHKVHAVYIQGARKSDVAIDISATLEKKVSALKLHQSQLGDWDPTEMITQWAQEEAKAARKRAKKQSQKAKADDGSKLQYAEVYRVMTLVDQPQES